MVKYPSQPECVSTERPLVVIGSMTQGSSDFKIPEEVVEMEQSGWWQKLASEAQLLCNLNHRVGMQSRGDKVGAG